MHGFIYAIHNESSGKVYVGQTTRSRVERRWYEHRLTLAAGRGTNRHLQAAWTHHGQAAFHFEPLERVDAETLEALKAQLTQREDAWMRSFVSKGLTLYNAQAAGDSTAYLRRGQPSPKKGVPMSEDQRQKVVASLQGNTRRKGTATSAQGRANISASKKGRPGPNRGKTLPEEQRRKISTTKMGTTPTDSTRAKMRASAAGRTWSLVDGKRVYSKPINEEAPA